jgi:hypothetical protein
VLVSVFLAVGLLFGMGAMVIDVGRLYQNRAELQNGADAGALALAASCAAKTCSTTNEKSIALPYANENASALTGNTADVYYICGSSGSGLTGCTGSPVNCPANPASGNFVDVITNTKVGTGTLLPPIFAQSLVSGYNGTEQKVCAQATWGESGGIGFTVCAALPAASSPQLTWPLPTIPASDDTVLSMSNGNCGGSAGNFGWTDNCPVFADPSDPYGGSTGASPKGACGTEIANAWALAKAANISKVWDDAIFFLPLYSQVVNPGSNATYTLDHYVGFVVTSYDIPSVGSSPSDWLSPSGGCKVNKCISGFFVNRTLTVSASGVRLIG